MMPVGPFQTARRSVHSLMYDVCLALVPAMLVKTLFITPYFFFKLIALSLFCVILDSLFIFLRYKTLSTRHILDGSSLVTTWLITLSLPSIAPWWLLLLAVLIALIIGKYLYGGLGQNPFNPAMLAYAACLISFPALMSQWVTAVPDLSTTGLLLRGVPIDAIASATPIDHLKTQLHQHLSLISTPVILGQQPYTLVNLAYLLGGLYLLCRRTIRWPLPLYFLIGLLLPATFFWLYDAARYAPPLFHLLYGSTMIGAFFIVTDPVSGPSTPRAQCLLGLFTGACTYIIRVFGGYPDGLAFAILIMNMLVPLVDRLTPPPIFGQSPNE